MVPGLLQGLRYLRTWSAIGAGLLALVVYLSLTPDPVDAGRIEDVKVGHFVAYALLMLWFAQLLRPAWARIALAGALVLMGIGLEYAQGMTSYRTFAYADMRDNAIGVAAGFALALTPFGTTLMAFEEWIAA